MAKKKPAAKPRRKKIQPAPKQPTAEALIGAMLVRLGELLLAKK